MKLKTRVSALFLGASLTLGGCAGNQYAKSYTKGVIPKATKPTAKDIVNTKKLLDKELKGKARMYQNGDYYNRSKRIVTRLSRAAGLGSWSYPVYIADAGSQVNAMAVNDNTIVVYKKLVDNIGSDDSLLATVLAHEVSHMVAQHGKDSTSRNRTTGILIGTEILGAIIGSRTGSASAAVFGRDVGRMVGLGTLVRPYDRSMELEADHVGMLLMAKAGYNPRSAIRFWKNSTKYLGSSSGNDFLSTHPNPGNRLAELEETSPLALKYYRKR